MVEPNFLFSATIFNKRTSPLKLAAGRWVQRAWHITGKGFQLTSMIRFRYRYC
jgi:hypothetical protein